MPSSTDHDKEDDDFIKVEPKFKYKTITTSKNKKKRKNKKNIRYEDASEWTINDMIKQLETYREKLTSTKFYEALKPLISECLEPRQCQDIVCYGVGSMQDSIAARYQFILILLIRDIIKIKGTISIFDPVMTTLDKEACEHFNVIVIKEDEGCKRTVTTSTLFYMPHCTRIHYSNTISANWTRELLQNVTIIGNDFDDVYVTSQPDSVLRRDCPYLVPASSIIESVPFPDHLFDINNVFNNLAFQHFPLIKIPQETDVSFWQNVATSIDDDDK
ncbi:SRR1-domain-containing protein [Halteromyces radiatus]|uniref:SRR1-domain-containing protein n=1 Tax=Halteromyces radiatus TaxID=101107 RepID=UPI0022208671|nr:SRR1-domain-containing protein [Halteromyces radiatus]KAI8076341.1 SRR1-domain-containing protein [Halteromyces radiatus]